MAHHVEACNYEKDFDADWYVSNFCTNIFEETGEGGRLKFSLDCLHDIFKNGEIGGTLLDISTGPTVHSIISASRHVTEIHLSDLVDRNRDVLQKWRDGEPNATPSFQYIMERENYGSTIEDRTALARDKVTRIYPLDMRQPELLPDSRNKYDAIIASLAFSTVAKDNEDFGNIIDKVTLMLKPIGYLVIIDVIGGIFYTVGKTRFDILNLNRDDTMEVFRNAGFKINVWKELSKEGYTLMEKAQCIAAADDFYFACCRKCG